MEEISMRVEYSHCVCNDTATTEIYTYVRTRSLHDARPICLSSYYTFYLIHKFGVSVQSAQVHLFVFLFAVAAGSLIGGPIGDRIGRKRSDEHTSELQSLMRLSYAVFCLNTTYTRSTFTISLTFGSNLPPHYAIVSLN